jgi:hypothetical protein
VAVDANPPTASDGCPALNLREKEMLSPAQQRCFETSVALGLWPYESACPPRPPWFGSESSSSLVTSQRSHNVRFGCRSSLISCRSYLKFAFLSGLPTPRVCQEHPATRHLAVGDDLRNAALTSHDPLRVRRWASPGIERLVRDAGITAKRAYGRQRRSLPRWTSCAWTM